MENQIKIHDASGMLLKQYGLKMTKGEKAVLNGSLSYGYGTVEGVCEIDFCAFGKVAEHIASLEVGAKFVFTAFEKRESYTTKSGEPVTKSTFNVVWLERQITAKNGTRETMTVSSSGEQRKLTETRHR